MGKNFMSITMNLEQQTKKEWHLQMVYTGRNQCGLSNHHHQVPERKESESSLKMKRCYDGHPVGATMGTYRLQLGCDDRNGAYKNLNRSKLKVLKYSCRRTQRSRLDCVMN